MSYRVFGGFKLDVTLPRGFIDSSYHNDAMPSWSFNLPNDERLVIYIDYADPAMREVDDYERFALYHYSASGACEELVRSDDWQDILSYLARPDIANLMSQPIVSRAVSPFDAVQGRVNKWLKA